MKKDIGALVYHCSEGSNEARRLFCSEEPNTGLPKIVREAIMPTFQELSDDTLLKRCLHDVGFSKIFEELSMNT